jgi:4-amino-4-deoxy-L-arabinose transferase-like glycosyltransferase
MLRKKKILIRSVFYATLLITLIIFTIITAYSFFQSGYWYSFDNDEISHTQKAYLLLQGYIPYKQFFSIYTPVFHWFISPFVLLSGYKLETLHVLRIVMIALFIIRTACTYIVVRKIFGKLPALFFVSLTFLDPLTAMAGMQIRPDNLMLAFLAAGMAALTIALQNSAKGWFMLTTGILCSLAFLTQLKALPTLFIIALITTIFLVKQKKSKLIVYALFSSDRQLSYHGAGNHIRFLSTRSIYVQPVRLFLSTKQCLCLRSGR